MTTIATCPTCGLNYEVLDKPHACPPSVQPCRACGGQYGSQHVCLPVDAATEPNQSAGE